MKINGLSETKIQMGGRNMTQETDSVIKNIQNQIVNAQKSLQELSANKDMSIEEKMKKRQEIQQQINELNQQLRQHQIEQRKEKQQKKESSMDDMLGGNKKTYSKVGKQATGLSQGSMKAMLSADCAMAQAQVQGSVATKMEGKAGVLTAEIKRDEALGGDVTKKKEELEEVQKKAVSAQTAQMSTLADANKELEEAAKEEQQAEKAGDKDKKISKKEEDYVLKEKKASTESNENLLSKTGITIGKGNKMEFDEEALKKADISTLKTLFTGHNSFADKISMKANSISNAAARISGIYKSNGTYSNALTEVVSSKLDAEV